MFAWGIFMGSEESFIINDNRIALVLSNKSSNNMRKIYNIILLRTNEIVGTIGFDSEMNNEVMYSVLPQYQKMHIATDALGLLKKLMYNIYQDDSLELYIVAVNKASSKVALNNGGILIPSWEEYPDYYFRAKHYKIRVKSE